MAEEGAALAREDIVQHELVAAVPEQEQVAPAVELEPVDAAVMRYSGQDGVGGEVEDANGLLVEKKRDLLVLGGHVVLAVKRGSGEREGRLVLSGGGALVDADGEQVRAQVLREAGSKQLRKRGAMERDIVGSGGEKIRACHGWA